MLSRGCVMFFRSKQIVYVSSLIYGAKKHYSNDIVLGIETSCDDTGCAIINSRGELLSQHLYSQALTHLRNGGIIPDLAQDLHRAYLEPVVLKTLQKSKLTMDSISAIAVTTEPGLPLSLAVGMKYAKHLARRYSKPIIPIHHMQAHALAARMHNNIKFPYLTLLISGGHCLLAVVQDVNDFKLIGESIDIAPGEMLDKIARKMKLRNLPEYSKISGGLAIELAALKASNPNQFQLPLPLSNYKDCNFSFNGLKTSVLYNIDRKEKEHQVTSHNLIPEVNDLCAATLMATTRHLLHRTQRAMEFCYINNLIPENNKQLVISGGVACNNYIFQKFTLLCEELNYNIFRPAPNLCTDNGVMIAWNGLEKWQKNIDIVTRYEFLDINAVKPIGENLIPLVKKLQFSSKRIKINM